MTALLIDTGPLVALLNRRDRYHVWIRDLLDTVQPPLFTCEPVLSEACFLLQRLPGGQDAVLELVSRGILKSDFRAVSEIDSLRSLMRKFADVPMSLADAARGVALTTLAERRRCRPLPTVELSAWLAPSNGHRRGSRAHLRADAGV